MEQPKDRAAVPAAFQILEFCPRSSGSSTKEPDFNPKAIKRLSDGEVFNLGDRVTNGTQMVGEILEFGLLDGDIFVETTWSGVGMNLESLKKVPVLPCEHQVGDPVYLLNASGRILNVHFHGSNLNVTYDVECSFQANNPYRLYNIHPDLLTAAPKRKSHRQQGIC